tara:strand:+ start:2786 stop:3142 length:357 start_codon:yes stop_codon:yes gene_type:complete
MSNSSKGLKTGPKSKQELASTKTLSKREQSSALREFRAKLLLNPKSERLIEKLFDLAFNDESKQQSVALKILSDRLMPIAGFTSDGKAQATVSINISGLSSPDAGVTINGNSGELEND